MEGEINAKPGCTIDMLIMKEILCMYDLGVSINFEITVAFGQKFHWYFRTLSLKFQKLQAILK